MPSPLLSPLLQRASFAAVVYGRASEILEWNAGAERIFGFSAAEAVGRKIPDLLGGKEGVVRKDGKRILCRWQEEKADDGAVLAIVDDVTEWRTRERLLGALLDNLAIVVWQVDTKGTFVFHDGKKGLERIGMKPGQVLGGNIFELYKDGAGADVVAGAFKGEATYVVGEAHGQAWATWTLPLRDDTGEVDAAMGISLDITESRTRENELRAKLELIENQQRMIKDLSIPLIETWEGVLTVPMVGAVDTERASEVMERLLTEITKRRARYAIVDLTGVEEVDTDVAAHIISLTRAIQLLGAEGIVTGIRPTMAQAMIQLGADLSGIRTLANLREALAYCIAKRRKDAQT